MTLTTLTPREASIFACVCETVVAPGAALPPVRQTDAVAFVDYWLARSPLVNRVALRAALYLAELAPRLLRIGGRLRTLSERDRARTLQEIESLRSPHARQLVKAVKTMAFLSYYGDPGILLQLGYDAEANVDRGRELRVREARAE